MSAWLHYLQALVWAWIPVVTRGVMLVLIGED